MVMADISRQQKLASAKKKLKRFQKAKTPTSDVTQPNHNLSKEILNGIQNNHIFQTPPLGRPNEKTSTPNTISVNQKLSFQTPPETPAANTPTSLIGAPRDAEVPTEVIRASSAISQDENIESSIASYKRSNQQLTEQVHEQRKQILLLQDKLKKEVGVTSQLTEQRALKEQLEVHIQTIGILVSEKSELQSNISSYQKKLTTKEKEFIEINNELNSARQRLLEFEKLTSQLQLNETQLKQINKDVIQERDRFSSDLYGANQRKEELQLQNSELQVKLKAKVEECSHFLNQVNELHAKLQKGDLMIQQLSANSFDPSVLNKWNEEKESLMKTVNDQKSMLEKLVSDKAELSQKHSDLQSHYDIQVEELRNKINTMENEKSALLERTQNLSITLEQLQQELEKSTTEVIQVSETQPTVESNKDLEKAQSEKQELERELDIQITENRRLGRIIFEQNQKIESLETSITQLNADSADKSSLLNQIQSDKETISRALQQNKTLKEQIEELQEAFVKMSTSSADLTTKLQSEQHGSKDVAEKLSTVQLELEETKVKFTDKSSLCDELEKQLSRFKEELNNVQMKLAEKEMDLDLVNTELETMKVDMTNKQKENTDQQASFSQEELSGKLNEELSSAQDTINMLSYQNEQLKVTINELRNNVRVDSAVEAAGTSDIGYGPSAYEEVGVVENELTEEEQHARNWGELENDSSDGEDSGYTNEAIQYTQAEVDSLQANLNNLQEERVKILNLLQKEREKAFAAVEKIEEHVELKVDQQIKIRERELQEHFYEQTEALHSKVKSLQEALEVMRKNEDIADFDMTSDGITMPLLKTAFMQLQKRYKKAMDAKAQLADRIEQLEHMNMKLETETETIGEYIALYQTQRQALKAKFAEKDSVITQLSNEHARMQSKVSQLHHLVMQMLSERSGIESKNKTLQELVNRRLALQTGGETSEVPNLEYNLDSLFGQMTLTPEENELAKDSIIVNNEELSRDIVSDQTTQQILNIFEQLETTGEGYQFGWLSPAARKHSFQPCKNCSKTLIHV